jgi:hypothetical protein
MPKLARVVQAPFISEGRNQYPKGALMAVMAAEVGTSPYKATPSYLPYCTYAIGSTWQQQMDN